MLNGQARRLMKSYFEDLIIDIPGPHERASIDYICDLLVEFVDRDALDGCIQDASIFSLYQHALQCDPLSKFEAFRNLGDVSVFYAGFFKEYVQHRRSVGLGYYIDMGATGYLQASYLSRSVPVATMFRGLADNIEHVVCVLDAVSRRTCVRSSSV